MLVADTVDDNSLPMAKPSSPKKQAAPQPKPRTLLSLSSSSEMIDCDESKTLPNNNNDESEDQMKRKSQVFMNKNVSNSVLHTHKACINELALKLEKRNSVDFAKIESSPGPNQVFSDPNISIREDWSDKLPDGTSTVPYDPTIPEKMYTEESQQTRREISSADSKHVAALVVDKMKGVHVHV